MVRFDTTNTYGESEGNPEDETVTSDLSDLEDVIAWAGSQPWYREPFYLAGHSLGGMCATLYAEQHPEKMSGLAPISTTISGALSIGTKMYPPELLAVWEKAGVRVRESETVPGRIKRLKWTHMIDRMKYDLLPEARKLTMPVLLVVGELDDSTHTAGASETSL